MIDPHANMVHEAERLIAVLAQLHTIRGTSTQLDYLASELARIRRNMKATVDASAPVPPTRRAQRGSVAYADTERIGPKTPASPQPR